MSLIRQELTSSRTAMTHVVANPALRRIFAAFAGSLIGDGVFALSAAVFVYRSGGATAVGVLAVCRYVLIAVVAPLGAALADRYDRRLVMTASDVLRLVVVVIAAALITVHGPRVAVYALIILVGLAGTAFRPAQAAILPSLSREEEELSGANVLSSTIESIGFFAGPAVAGLLLAFSSIAVAFAFDAVTFVWSVLLLWGIRLPDDDERTPAYRAQLSRHAVETDTAAETFLHRALQGFREIARHRDIRTLAILYVLQCVVAGASAVFTVAIALRMLHIGNSGLGLMESTLGIGGLVGGFVALMLMQRSRLATHFAIGIMMWGAPLVIIAIFPNEFAALLTMGLIGVANSIVDVNAITVLQHQVPNEVLGRVMGAIEAGDVGGMAIGSLAMTLLIHVTGLREGLAWIGVVVTVLVVPGLPAMRRIDGLARGQGLRHHPRHDLRPVFHQRLRRRYSH